MSATIFDLKREKRRRIDLFRIKCANLASNRAQFLRNFIINQDHIVIRGTQQNSSLRQAIEPIHIAAVVIHGRINYQSSNDGHPIEVAIDGLFKNFRYVEFQTSGGSGEFVIPKLQLRIVLRDKKIKILVVTVYPMRDSIDDTIPEVNYEVW